MNDKTKNLIKKILSNAGIGAIAIGFFVFIAEYFSHGLSGYLAGTVPTVITYMIIYSYINGSFHKMVNVACMGSISAIIYILYCLSFVFISIYLCADKKANFGVSLTISFIIWIGLNCLLVFVILPKFGVNLLNKQDGINNMLLTNVINKQNKKCNNVKYEYRKY